MELVKANTMHAPTTCQGEDHDDLVLGLRVTATERADQDTQRTCVETVEGEDNEACPELPVRASLGSALRQASAQTASANLQVHRRGFDVDGVVPVIQGVVDQEGSEDEENGGRRVRKKLRLSKEQSAFLEDSFKEHSTLTLLVCTFCLHTGCLANRLSLRPRQVEVWFQNRRARTKLKQTEADCENLKRHCEALARENRRLQLEVAELRGFRAPYTADNHHLSGFRFSTGLPAACPSCDAATTHSTITAVSSPGPAAPSTLFPRPLFGPFTSGHPVLRRQPWATS